MSNSIHNRVDEVTIVGGGTAGWLTATFLVTALNHQQPDNPVKVNVIVSPKMPIIGVGESTLPVMPSMLQLLNIDEHEFISRTNATFKCAGRFVNWNVDQDDKPTTFYTPFNMPETINGYHPAYYFKRFGSLSGRPQYADNVMPNTAVIEAMKAPRTFNMGQYEYAIGYSYHLDARLFAQQLQEIAIARGVNFISDDVVDVHQDERGYVDRLTLEQGGDMPVQLVVDCTGFKGVFIKQTLQEPFDSYKPYFLCDRAYPVMVEHKDQSKILPATTATGLSAGWMWNVPLYNRIGTGYVYSSDMIDDQTAQDELMQQLGHATPLNEPRVVPFAVGVTRRSWVKNVVAIGLSGGFVEPLEATAIGMIDKAARWLIAYFPDKGIHPSLSRQFNHLMDKAQSEIRDFIFMHYWLSNRLDSEFWRAVRFDMTVPETLEEKLELWSHVLPSEDTTMDHQMFGWDNYNYALFGKGFLDMTNPPLSSLMMRPGWKQYTQMLNQARDNMLKALPSHYELLTHIRQHYASSAA